MLHPLWWCWFPVVTLLHSTKMKKLEMMRKLLIVVVVEVNLQIVVPQLSQDRREKVPVEDYDVKWKKMMVMEKTFIVVSSCKK